MPAVRTQPSGPKPLVETKTCAPKTWPCPVCGRPGRRERTLTRWARHLAHGRQAWWKITVGVYRAKCVCCRELMRNDQVIEHLGEDFHLFISVGFIYLCLDWEKKRAA